MSDIMNVESMTAVDKEALKEAVMTLSDSMLRVSSERELQKDTLSEVSEKIGLDKALIRRMAKVHFKANFTEVVEGDHTFEEFYDTVMK